eukprot:2861047-Ditylum_brightwellii.AAC.1
MGLWADTLAYQLSSATGLSGLMHKKDDVLTDQGLEPKEEGSLPVVALLADCEEDEKFIANIRQ